jgi:hypothetical protein
MKYHQTSQFKKLRDQWYRKLAKSGFEDIEKLGHTSTEPVLITCTKISSMTLAKEVAQEYYVLITHRVSSEKFDCPEDEIVMRRISNGIRIKVISEELKSLGYKNERKTIRYIIRKYEQRWGIKKWKPEQLTYRKK